VYGKYVLRSRLSFFNPTDPLSDFEIGVIASCEDNLHWDLELTHIGPILPSALPSQNAMLCYLTLHVVSAMSQHWITAYPLHGFSSSTTTHILSPTSPIGPTIGGLSDAPLIPAGFR
jgi:hypothetical protein